MIQVCPIYTVAAVALVVLSSSSSSSSSDVHSSRPHNGQQVVASRLRSLLHSDVHHSEISGDHVTIVMQLYTVWWVSLMAFKVNEKLQFTNF